MKKKIAILGSTGSIGKNIIDIISKDKKNFEVVLLTTNQNTKTLLKQAKYLKAKNIIVKDKKEYLLIKNKLKKVNIFSNFDQLDKIFKSKVDYIMSAISGIDGLEPTFRSIKHTKKVMNGDILIAETKELEQKEKTSSYLIKIVNQEGIEVAEFNGKVHITKKKWFK